VNNIQLEFRLAALNDDGMGILKNLGSVVDWMFAINHRSELAVTIVVSIDHYPHHRDRTKKLQMIGSAHVNLLGEVTFGAEVFPKLVPKSSLVMLRLT
jgi:hypothetical protein